MTTIKLNKKSSETTSNSRGPVRRADPSKRDRSKALPPKFKPENAQNEDAQNKSARQRNHRHDGSLRDAPKAERAPTDGQPVLRSDFKDRAFVGNDGHNSNREQYHPQQDNRSRDNNRAPDNRQDDGGKIQAETTRNYADREGNYRNPPRRGGKARDGFVASEFDKSRAGKTAAHQKAAEKLSVTQGNPQPRLSKLMADIGLCSRREADDWIVNGWVKVDGKIIDVLGSRVNPDAEIVVSAYAMEHQSESVTILLHKPVGHVSGQAEDGYQPAIVLVHPDNEWIEDPDLNEVNEKEFQRGFLHGLAPAGRLDIDSTGLLVLTQDGRVARRLIGQDTSVEKEYLVRVEGELSDKDLESLNHGLHLDGEELKPAKVSWQNEDQLRFVLREGKKRQIRRMCEMVGLHVVGLKRVRIGSVNLGKLPVGMWRYLRDNESF
ncbi:MAG: 23S rRNA pseudouridine2604 synthase [Methylophilaceae bacterium]